MSSRLAILFTLCVLADVVNSDSCNSYSVLSDASRSIMIDSGYGCADRSGDYNLNGWYRFMGDAGDMMLDYCPLLSNSYECGARFKAWLTGGHPAVNEGEVQRTVYFYGTLYGCYLFSTSVKVRNCGRFFVYRLQRTLLPVCVKYCGNGKNYTSSTIMPSSSSLSISSSSASVSSSRNYESSTIMTSSSSISTTSTPVSGRYPSSIFMSSSAAVQQRTTTAPRKSDDGCTQYQLLSDPTRAITYGDLSYRRCDDKLYGWYRFTGDAGNRMLDYCPLAVSGSRYNRCGTGFQGWITSGSTMPRRHEGEVSRLVCFSDSNSCRCQYQTQIKVRNCGKFYVYWLKGVPTCHQRYCGVKDQSAVVSCSQNYMRIELDRNFFNASAYSSITLKDPRCRASTSYSHINLGTIPSQCGSQRKETYDYIIYENEVIMKAKPTTGLITRESDMRIRLSCSYNKNGFVSFVSFKPVSTINVTEAAYGNFTYYFRMYTDSSYRMVHSHFPAQVKLRDWLYFEAYASVVDTKLVVLIEQCYSTPTMDRNHPDKYVFINERCPADKTVQFFSASANRQRFSLQAYKYVQNSTAVYIHCVVFICHQSSKHGRCRTGCSGNNVNRVRRDLEGGSGYTRNQEGYSKFYLVEAGPITLDRSKEILQSKKGTKSNFSTTSLLLIVGVAVLVIVVAALIIKMRRSNTTAGNKQLEVGIDHAPNGQEYVITGEDPPSPGLNEDEKKEEAV